MDHVYRGRAAAALSSIGDFYALVDLVNNLPAAKDTIAELRACQDGLAKDLEEIAARERALADREREISATEARQTDIALNLGTDRANLEARRQALDQRENDMQARLELVDQQQAGRGAVLEKGFQDLQAAKEAFAAEIQPKRDDIEARTVALREAEKDLAARLADFEARYAKAKAILDAAGE